MDTSHSTFLSLQSQQSSTDPACKDSPVYQFSETGCKLSFWTLLDRYLGSTDSAEVCEKMPPLTRYELKMLDLEAILGNPQIRHDLLFYNNLTLRTSIHRHQESRVKKASRYWECLEREIKWIETWEQYVLGKEEPPRFLYLDVPLLYVPLLLNEVREILMEIISFSEESQRELNRMYDIRRGMEGIQRGSLEMFGEMIMYTINLLETHVHSSRLDQIANLDKVGREGKVIDFFRELFGLMEQIKLDSINEKIGKQKRDIIEQTPTFEWDMFCRDIKNKKITTFYLEEWIHKSLDQWMQISLEMNQQITCSMAEFCLDAYYMGVLNTVAFEFKYFDETTEIAVPETFRWDKLHFKKLHNTWTSLVLGNITILAIKQVMGQRRFRPDSDQIDQLWKELNILLSSSEIRAEHIELHVFRFLDRILTCTGKDELGVEERVLLKRLMDEYRIDTHPVHMYTRKKLWDVVFGYFKRRSLDNEVMVRGGWKLYESTIQSFCGLLVRIMDHNIRAYRTLYGELWSKHMGMLDMDRYWKK